MEGTGLPVGYGSHRVRDAQDPPRELSGLAWGAFVCLGVLALVDVGRIFAALKLHSVAGGQGDVLGAYRTYSSWIGFAGLATLLAAVVFVAWFFRAYKNLRRLGVQNMRYGDGWAIGSWLIPIFNLVRPKQIANDVWRGSERGVEVGAQWRQVFIPGLVHWWWALFVVQGTLTYFGQRMTASGYNDLGAFGLLGHGFSQIRSGTVVDVLGEIVAIVGLVLAIRMVAEVTERLDEIRGEALAAGAGTLPMASYPPAPSYPPAAAVAPATGYQPSVAPVSVPPPPPAPVEPRIQCPQCAEWIQPQAKVCRFCGHRLHPDGR
jgi:hypothetical protein